MSNIDDINRKIRADNERAKNLTDMCTEGDFRANRPTRQYTTEDFQKAQFARADDGLLAIRAFPGESKPWLFVTKKGIVAGRPDGSMAREGWAPVTDQVSGRTNTYTESQVEVIGRNAVAYFKPEAPWADWAKAVFISAGISVVPDPKSTNSEKLAKELVTSFNRCEFDFETSFEQLAKALDARGITAPEADDE